MQSPDSLMNTGYMGMVIFLLWALLDQRVLVFPEMVFTKNGYLADNHSSTLQSRAVANVPGRNRWRLYRESCNQTAN